MSKINSNKLSNNYKPHVLDMVYLNSINKEENLKKYFGSWIKNVDALVEQFNNAEPSKHIIIENFLESSYAEKISQNYPTDFENWWSYNNPIEVKYANDDINNMCKPIKDLFYILSSNELINLFSKLSNIQDLEYDPYLHGAGLHAHPRYGRLNIHLDYEKHPILENKGRRLNIILYLSKDWKNEWNGATELWDENISECKVKSYVKFNSAIVFQTNEISWHGLPEKIMCPEGVYRKSLAYYYISQLTSKHSKNKIGNNGSGYRTKATFVKRPKDPYLPQMAKLYKIRPHRRITENDMEEIWPEWNSKDY